MRWLACLVAVLLLAGCATVPPPADAFTRQKHELTEGWSFRYDDA